jgi:hypothetical protein
MLLGRRKFLTRAGAFGLSLGGTVPTLAQPTNPDYTIKIAPMSVELAPGKVIQTYGYNGTVPGPVLRLQENRQVSIRIVNDTDIDDIIHWHGLFVPPEVDGANGGRIADGSRSRWFKTLHVHPQTDRDTLVSQPRCCRERSDAQHVCRSLWVPDRRTHERSRTLR